MLSSLIQRLRLRSRRTVPIAAAAGGILVFILLLAFNVYLTPEEQHDTMEEIVVRNSQQDKCLQGYYNRLVLSKQQSVRQALDSLLLTGLTANPAAAADDDDAAFWREWALWVEGANAGPAAGGAAGGAAGLSNRTKAFAKQNIDTLVESVPSPFLFHWHAINLGIPPWPETTISEELDDNHHDDHDPNKDQDSQKNQQRRTNNNNNNDKDDEHEHEADRAFENPIVGNGHVSTVIDSPHINVLGMPRTTTKQARPVAATSFSALRLGIRVKASLETPLRGSFSVIDLEERAVHRTSRLLTATEATTSTSGDGCVLAKQTWYAHAEHHQLLVHEVEIINMRADSIPVSVVQLPPSNIDHEDLAAPVMVSWLPLLNSDNDDDDDGGRRMLKTTILGYLVVTAPSEAQSFTFTELAATDEIPPSALAWSGLGATTVMVIARLQSATFSIVTAATIVASSVQVLPSSSRQLQVLQWMGRVQQSETTGSADLNAPDARQVLEDLKQSVFSTPAQHRLLYALHRSAVSNPFSSNAIQLLGSVSHLNHAIQLALYTIASSVGSGELLSEFGVGSSPIAHECNEGLVSQDMERWLMLALLPFESGAATVRQLLEFRASQLQTARNAAKSALPSAAAPGAKYPTFGGPSGADEASVDANLMELGAMDVDSTSFVALAVEQFDYAKHDPRWVASVGQPMAQSCAEFGRAKLVGMEFSGKTVRTTRAALAERSFDVRRGSHSPTAIYPAQRAVDHDLLTNGLVQRSLRYSGANLARKPVTAEYGAQLQSEADSVALPFAKTDADEKSLQQAYVTEAIAQRDASTPANLAYSWTRTRNAHYPRHVIFPSVSKAGVTPYNPASALALGFPVMHPMPLSVRRNDLAQFTSFVKFLPLDSGLPTDHALAAIAGFEVGDAPRTSFHLHQLLRSVSDHEQAWLQYPRFYSTEMRGLQCVHSLSAAGAMLQVILYGSLGLRYLPTGVRLRPVLPSEDATGLSFRDLKYGSCSFNIFIHSRQVVVVANPARCREKPLLAATIGEAETLAFNPLPLSAPIGSAIVLAFSSDDGKAAAVLARSISVDDSAQLAPHDTDAQLAVDGALTPHGFQPADATNSLALDDDDEERGSDGQSALHVPLDAIMHKHGGIPDGLTAVIVISIIVFHVLLFQLIYREFCRASSATARRRGS